MHASDKKTGLLRSKGSNCHISFMLLNILESDGANTMFLRWDFRPCKPSRMDGCVRM